MKVRITYANGFTTVDNPYDFARAIAGDYSTKAEREALRRLWPRFGMLKCEPIEPALPDVLIKP